MTENAHHPPLLFGEVLYDCFEDGSRVLGGAPFNVAWHLHGFGLKPVMISRVGDDPLGHQIRRRMIDWGMSTVGLQLDSRHATGEVKVVLRDGQPSYDIVADRAWDHLDATALPPLQPSLIYHGSLGLRSADSASCFAQLCERFGSPRYFDVNLRPPYWQAETVLDLIGQCRWLKINDDELTQLIHTGDRLEDKAALLQERCDLAAIIVTQGAAGAFLRDEQGNLSHIAPASQIEVVDTVGAGDAFAAVTLLGILLDWPASLTLERAQQFAALIVGQRGAIPSDPSVYDCQRQIWGLTAHPLS